MIIDRATLITLGIGFKASFQGGLSRAPTDHERIAMQVPSSTGREEYGWMNRLPSAREWIGDRVVQNMGQSGYSITNKDFELTLGVDRNHIEDDNLGIYGMMFEEIGSSTSSKACELVYGLLAAGFTTPCYDGQNFFSTTHPVLDANGNAQSVANTDGGAGTPWFLIDTSRVFKPIILQTRKDWDFVSKDNLDDDNVFMRKEFLYGADARMNVGFGLWQLAWGSRQPLNQTNYATARAAMMSMKGDHGRPLGLRPNLLVVPGALESAGRKILRSELGTGGETNEWANSAELMVTSWL